jgi:GNAT superfamily N-acetyltransferase
MKFWCENLGSIFHKRHQGRHMAVVSCKAVTDVNFDAFTHAFNLAYSDYLVPISMTPPAFQALIDRDDLILDASVAAVDEAGQIVGTGLLGIRGRLGWIGGMGVIPSRRREGIGRQMMHYLIEQARTRGLTRIDLEVIENNTVAHSLYCDLGFIHTRYLLILEREPGSVPADSAPYRIEERPVSELLTYYDAFHEMPNCWQRGYPSLEALMAHLESWAVVDGNTVLGYALGWANDLGVRLVDFAARPGENRIEAAQALLVYLHRENPEAYGSSYNIAEDDPVLPAFQAAGYKTAFRQIEMRLPLVQA